MGKGLCRVVDLVDKCEKLCRTGVGSTWNAVAEPVCGSRVFHVERVRVRIVPVARCGRCVRSDVFHVERGNMGHPLRASCVPHLLTTADMGTASVPRGQTERRMLRHPVFHMEHMGHEALPGEEDALLGGWEGDGWSWLRRAGGTGRARAGLRR